MGCTGSGTVIEGMEGLSIDPMKGKVTTTSPAELVALYSKDGDFGSQHEPEDDTDASEVFARPSSEEYEKEMANQKAEAKEEMKKMKAMMGGRSGASGMFRSMLGMSDGMAADLVENDPYFTVTASSCWLDTCPFNKPTKIYGFRYKTPKGNPDEFATEAAIEIDGR